MDSDNAFGCIALIMFVLVLAFWGVVGFVAWHFIAMYW